MLIIQNKHSAWIPDGLMCVFMLHNNYEIIIYQNNRNNINNKYIMIFTFVFCVVVICDYRRRVFYLYSYEQNGFEVETLCSTILSLVGHMHNCTQMDHKMRRRHRLMHRQTCRK